MNKSKSEQSVLVGIDIGSTTTKIAAMDTDTHQLLFADYKRRHADQIQSVIEGIKRLESSL